MNIIYMFYMFSRDTLANSGLFVGCFGLAVAAHLQLGHLHVSCVCREAVAHALNGLLVVGLLLLQRADHVLHLALACQEALYTVL